MYCTFDVREQVFAPKLPHKEKLLNRIFFNIQG